MLVYYRLCLSCFTNYSASQALFLSYNTRKIDGLFRSVLFTVYDDDYNSKHGA